MPDKRRDILSWLLRGSAVAIGAPIVAFAVKYLTPPPTQRRQSVGNAHDLPTIGSGKDETWRIARVGDVDVAVANDGKGDVIAFELRCTHAHCSLTWKENDDSFHCPCHGGRFNANGEPIEGPPGRSMKRLKTERRGEEVIVIVGG